MAEGDRDAYRREQAALAREREIMKDVPGWEVRERIHRSHDEILMYDVMLLLTTTTRSVPSNNLLSQSRSPGSRQERVYTTAQDIGLRKSLSCDSRLPMYSASFYHRSRRNMDKR